MWRSHTSNQGRRILTAAWRKFTTESSQGSVPPPIPPAPKKSRGFGFLKFLGVSTIGGGGGVLGYAAYDPEFRKQLEENIPYAKDVFDTVLPETEKPPVLSSSFEKKDPSAAAYLEKATMLHVQEDIAAAKTIPTEPIVTPAPVWWWIKLARCSTVDTTDASKKEGSNDRKKPDSYLSYCSATFDRKHAAVRDKVNHGEDSGDGEAREFRQEQYVFRPGGEPYLINDPGFYVAEALSASAPEEIEGRLTERFMCRSQNSLQNTSDIDVTKYLSYNLSYLSHSDVSVESSKGLQMAPEPQPVETVEEPEPEDIRLIDEPEIEMTKEDDEKADNAALEVAIYKLLTASQALTEDAIKAQQDVANYTQHHIKLLKHAMDDSTDILKKDEQWEAVAVAYRAKESAVLQADELVNASKRSIEKLQDVLADSKKNDFTRNNPAIYTATKEIVQLSKDLTVANAQVRQAESEAKVLMKYKDLVEKGRKQFQQELESLMPEVKIGATSKKLTEDELNSLIAHAHRRIEQLQRQLAEQMAMERQRLSKALEAQRQEDHGILIAAVADERLRSQNEFEADKQKLEMEFLVRQEGEVRRQLSRQSAAHSDHIKDVLAVQREQLQLDFNRELNAKILEERENFQTEVQGWISRLKGIEAAVDARAAGEQLARCAQDLWLACIALNSVIHFGDEEGTKALTPLRNEIETILSVGQKHPFVETVCSSIPELAVSRGVCTEEQLRKRFLSVASVCRRLGLIEESNTSLYKYIVSFLHSLVVFDNISAISQNDTVDLNTFDNFGLVAHAQFWMEHGNLEMALRFMNQLTGESRLAANDWMNEARLLLETRQAATTLTAYASATGLANTF